jgi:hypothetical protein
VNVKKDLDLRVWAEDVLFEDAIGPQAGYSPNDAAVVREKILRRVGEAPVVNLGSGFMGVVYGLPSGKILKLTRDPSEVEALSVMKGVQHPHLVQVFDAFYAVDDPVRPRPMGAGVIVRESIDRTAWKARDLFWQAAACGSRAAAEADDLCKGMDAYVAHLDAAVERNHLDSTFIEAVLSAVAKLRELGICTYDLHPDNIGLIAGRPVLYDVGAASVTGADPDVI